MDLLPTLDDWDFLVEGEWTDRFLGLDLKYGDFIELEEGVYYLDDNLRPKKTRWQKDKILSFGQKLG
jgi:hypothetical protein